MRSGAGAEKSPNLIEYFVASIGGCTTIKTQIILAVIGASPESKQVPLEGTRSEALSRIMKTVHVTIILKRQAGRYEGCSGCPDVMPLQCPDTVMAAASEGDVGTTDCFFMNGNQRVEILSLKAYSTSDSDDEHE